MENVEYLLTKLFDRDLIPVKVYDLDGKQLYPAEHASPADTLSLTHEMTIPMIERWKQSEVPCIMQDEFGLTFGFMSVDKACYIWGPFAENSLNVTELRHVREAYGIRNKDVRLTIAPLFHLIGDMEILYLFLTGQQLDEKRILRASLFEDRVLPVHQVEMDRYRFTSSENEVQRISHREEQVIMDAVRNGDLDYLQSLSYSVGYEHAGKLANNRKKHLEYMTVSGITMITRAAIEGGLPPEEAYNLSDLYLQKLEGCKTTVEVINLSSEATLDFVRRVKQLREKKENSSSYVDQCKDYIASYIHRPIRVEDIAEALGVNRSYLSTKFKEIEGVSIKEYITKERLRVACNMLRYFDESIATISDFLCFNSQSHFGKVFRQEMKMSPSEYRQKYKLNDMVEY